MIFTDYLPGHIVGCSQIAAALDLDWTCAAAEVVQEVVDELDQVHHCLGALDNLPVQRGLDVALEKGKN